jgi:hypothetical protein
MEKKTFTVELVWKFTVEALTDIDAEVKVTDATGPLFMQVARMAEGDVIFGYERISVPKAVRGE